MARKNLYPPSVTPGIPKLGKCPDGWMKTTFEDVLEVVKRKAELQDDVEYQLVNAKRNRGGIVPRAKALGKNILTKTQFYLKEGDFLISRRQIIHGACGVVPDELEGAIVSNEYSTLRTKDNILMDFLNYYCHSVYFQQTCFQSSVGVDVEKMIFDLNDWLSRPVYLPPILEQKKIVEILSSWDKVINQTEELIAAKKRLKKGMIQRLLSGQVRLPEFENLQGKKKTQFGCIPNDWEIIHLQDVAQINANNLSSETSPEREFGYVDLSSVDQGFIEYPSVKTMFKNLPSRARRILRKHDVIMSTVRPSLLSYATCDFDAKDILCSTGFALITPRIKTDSQFIYQSLYSDCIQRQFYGLVTGSNYPAVNSSEVSYLRLLWPSSVEERKKIGEVLQACDSEIELLQKKLTFFQDQKRGLMQRLLTGHLRVTIDEDKLLSQLSHFTLLENFTVLSADDYYQANGKYPTRIAIQKGPFIAHKLNYLPIDMEHEPYPMGPYSVQLHELLEKMEGIAITGYGDGSEAAEIKPNSQAVEVAKAFFRANPSLEEGYARYKRFIKGFESQFMLELLATVLWLLLEDPKATPEKIVKGVRRWSKRKRRIYNPGVIRKAYKHIREFGV